MRELNKAGLDFIIRWEGEKLVAYQDIAGVWTIGVGHTSAAGPPKVTKGMKITKEQSREILANDLRHARKTVEEAVKVPLTDNQFAVLVSFVHNLGEGNFRKSTLLKKLNAGDYKSVPSELNKWVYAAGKRSQGLANRRHAEGVLWNTPDASKQNPVPSKDVPNTPSTQPKTLLDLLVRLFRLLFGKNT